MPRHVEAWVDGAALSSLGPYWIQQIYEDAPALELTEGERPGRAGTLLLTRKRQQLKVALETVIAERFDLSSRAHYAEELARWAAGQGAGPHTLELSNHPERRLSVYLTGEPALTEVRNYAAFLRVEWTAYEVPYWEDKSPWTLAVTAGTTGTDTLTVPGTAETPVSLTVKPTGGTLGSFSVTAGGHTVALTGLSVSTSDTLAFERGPRDTLLIRSGSTSLLNKRSAASADDLLCAPGASAVSFTADAACQVTFSVRGRWL